MAGISRVELTIQAAVPPDPMEMRAAAHETVAQLDRQQVELVAWLAANLLEVIELREPSAMVYPTLLSRPEVARKDIPQVIRARR